MSIKTLIIATAMTCTLAALPAHALVSLNGWSENGWSENGWSENGWSENGWSENGWSENGGGENGLTTNGLGENGRDHSGAQATVPSSSAAPAFTLRAIVLPNAE